MKLGRNAPCPCGSGQKYKKCCYRKVNGKSLLSPKKTILTRRTRRSLKRAVDAKALFQKRVYDLSPALQQLPLNEWHIDDALFQHEAHRLAKEKRIKPPKGALDNEV